MLRHQHDENLFHLLFWQSMTYNFLAKVEIMRRQSVKSGDQCHLTVLRELIEVTCFLMLSADLWFFLIDASSGL